MSRTISNKALHYSHGATKFMTAVKGAFCRDVFLSRQSSVLTRLIRLQALRSIYNPQLSDATGIPASFLSFATLLCLLQTLKGSQLTSISVGLEPTPDSSGPAAVPSRIPKMSFGVLSTLYSQNSKICTCHRAATICRAVFWHLLSKQECQMSIKLRQKGRC